MREERYEESINEKCSELPAVEREHFIEFCKKHTGRLIVHLYRLLNNGRSKEEKDFAIAVIKNFDSIQEEIKDRDILEVFTDPEKYYDDLLASQGRLNHVLGSESKDSGAFWTFAPYIYKNLVSRGLDSTEAIRRIFNWGLRKKFSPDELRKKDQWHLKGFIQPRISSVDDLCYLPIEHENNIVHQFTNQEARKLVEAGIFDPEK
jgi:hypothetical protein